MAEHYIYGFHAVEALLKVRPKTILTLYIQRDRADTRLAHLVSMAASLGIQAIECSRPELNQRIGASVVHQGVMAACQQFPDYQERDLEGLLDCETGQDLILILDGVQDPHNLGACLRTANAMGAQCVIAPKNRAVGMTPVVRKVACGAAEVTPLVSVTNLSRVLRNLKERGIWLVGTSDQAKQALSDIDLSGPIGIVMGAEGKGLRRLTQEHCDYQAKIPMLGTVSSLNVSVATGICLYEVQRQRIKT